jgi:hypothetical protein
MVQCQIFPVSPFFEIYRQSPGDFFCNFVNVLITICPIIQSSSLAFGPETADRAASLHEAVNFVRTRKDFET